MFNIRTSRLAVVCLTIIALAALALAALAVAGAVVLTSSQRAQQGEVAQ